MKKTALTPAKLRLILSISLFFIAGAGIGLFYLANRELQAIAVDVSKISVDANTSRNNVQTLQTIQDELVTQQSVVDRANNLAASSQSYNYQNQIISDLNTYASRAGVTVTNIDFSTGTSTTSSATNPAATTPTEGATAAPGATSAPSGLNTATISVTLENPVEYTRLLNFFNMLEQSVPKLKVSKVNLSKSGDGGNVTSEVLSIEIYIR